MVSPIPVSALPPSATSTIPYNSNSSQGSVLPAALAKRMQEALIQVYGADRTPEMYRKITQLVSQLRQERNPALDHDDLARSNDWYKDDVVYMFYPDQFGVRPDEAHSHNTFDDLIQMLPYLKRLGVTTLYILPFLDSPMLDAGFDVRNPKNVRSDLGGLPAFQRFAAAARRQGFRIKADLILNHFSDQHAWFQDLLHGDMDKLRYFVTTDQTPVYRSYTDPQRGVVIDYQEPDGKVSSRRLIFSNLVSDHYRKVTLKGQDYYFYHTFYPFQLDINWMEPDVLYYALSVIGFWANQGIDIFRMDAIPYLIKKPGTDGENLPQTHAVVEVLSCFLQAVAPRSVMQAEACQWPKDILPYFGQPQTYPLSIKGKRRMMTRTDQVQIAYNFPYMPAIWASLVSQDPSHFWKAVDNTPPIPPTDAWANFLRVHDELSLEMVDVHTRHLIYQALSPHGAEFRKGLGVSGRMADFLDHNPDRIVQAFAILLSLPGLPIIYYGDEIGAGNNWDYAKHEEAERKAEQVSKHNDIKEVLSYYDSRDINRGPVLRQTLYNAMAQPKTIKGALYQRVQGLIKARRDNIALRRGKLQRLVSRQPHVLAYLRQTPKQSVVVMHNLSPLPVEATILLPTGVLSLRKGWQDRISGQPVRVIMQPHQLRVHLNPYQSYWLTRAL